MRRRVLASLTAAIGVALLGVTGLASADTDPGRIVVHERVPRQYTYFEGYHSFLTIRSMPSRRVVFHRRYEGTAKLNRRLPAGNYRLVFYLRTCAGTCDRLDRSVNERCSLRFRVDPGENVVTRVVHPDSEPRCRIVRVR